MGTLLVAGATSVPEGIVTIAALRVHAEVNTFARPMCSNLFDLPVIAFDAVFYTIGPLLAEVSPVHAVTAFSAAMMSVAVIVGLVFRPCQRVLRTMSVVGAAPLSGYLADVYLLFVHREQVCTLAPRLPRLEDPRNATAAAAAGPSPGFRHSMLVRAMS